MESETLTNYLAIVWRRRWLIALMLVLTLAVVFFRSATAKPTYSASVRLHISAPEREDITIFGPSNATTLRDEISEAKFSFLDTLKNESVAQWTIRDLGLQIKPKTLIDNLTIDMSANTNFIMVSLKSDSPEQAQTVINAHVDNTLRYIGALRAKPATSMREFISRRLESTAKEFDAANEALRSFRAKNNIGDLTNEIQSRQTLITSLYLEREKAYALGDTRLSGAYDAAIQKREQEQMSFAVLATEHDTLQAKVWQLQETYKFLLEKEAEAKLKEDQAKSVGYIEIVELAEKPEHPTPEKTLTYAIMGSIGSIIAGVVLIFLWEYGAKLASQIKLPQSEGGIQKPRALRPDER